MGGHGRPWGVTMSELPERTNNRGVVPEAERCQGWSRTEDRPCKQRRVPGSEYCHYHGGKNPKGVAHANFKHGQRSKYMPRLDLLDKYQRYLNDPELTHHRDSVALLDGMIQQALEEYAEGGTPELWRRLQATSRRMRVAERANDRQRWREAYEEVKLLIEDGAGQTAREKKVVSLLSERRKHADSETKRSLSEDTLYTPEHVHMFVKAVGYGVQKYILNPDARIAFSEEVVAMLEKNELEAYEPDADYE